MGKTTTPKYVIEYNYIDYANRKRATGKAIWNCKTDGSPTENNLRQWRDSFNASLQIDGANEHLRGSMSDISNVRILVNVTEEEVCSYSPPMFEII